MVPLARRLSALALASSLVFLGGCRATSGLGELLAPIAPDTHQTWHTPDPPPELMRIAVCAPIEDYARALTRLYTQQATGVHWDVVVVTPGLGQQMLAEGEVVAAILTTSSEADVLSRFANPDRWQVTSLATDGLALIVSSALPLKELGRTELVDLFTGYVLDWAELGAGTGPPEVVIQDESSTSRQVFDAELLGGHSPSTAAILVPDDHAAVAYVASHPLAVGYAAAATLSPDVQTVRIREASSGRLLSRNEGYAATLDVVMVCPIAMPREAYELRALAASDAGRRLAEEHFAATP